MRNLFPGYYQPTVQEFNSLWEEGIFSFDTNVLLHIYRYTPKTRDRFFDIFDKLKERVWIPHQVAFEYQKERFSVISRQSRAYDEIQKTLDKSLQNLKGELGEYKRHSLIEIEQIIEIFERAIKKVKKI
jgi:predicted nucleic acid-binding protein